MASAGVAGSPSPSVTSEPSPGVASVATISPPRAHPVAERGWADSARTLVLLLQLGLALLVIHQYQLESRTFFYMMAVAVIGFAVHATLPLRYRLSFFVFLSFTGIGLAFGPLHGAWLITAGLVLIGICHLPVRFGVRIALLVAAGAALAVSRAGALPAPWSGAVWPILASMFMFRLALYLYALRHDGTKPSIARTLAYFFMLPNVSFPLFPVVDYTTFARNHYDRKPADTYTTGVQWIVRGLLHLVLYRFVYLYVLTDPTELADVGDLARFLLGTFLLYLRVSGQFHLIIGVLHLFGFRLPETHRLYYLASSFTDFWRRINIYWKDFMMKLVYYPSFFRLRRWGGTVALVGATIAVFVVTWLLHSYQWFWLRGGFPVTAQDGIFWGLLGVLVVINALREVKRGRNRWEGTRGWSLSLAARTVGTFCAICILWSLWSAESVVEWLWMWRAAVRADATDLLLLGGLLAGGLVVGGRAWGTRSPGARGVSPGAGGVATLRWSPAVRTNTALLGLLALAQPAAYERPAPRLAATVASLQGSVLNKYDAELQHNGYYEQLDNPGRLSAQLWAVLAEKPADWEELTSKGVIRLRDDFIQHDLHPSVGVVWNGHRLTTNSWGMRDREYTLAKPAGTFRIAVLGPSHVMGSNVSDGEPFDSVLEERLNQEAALVASGRRYEVLNFAVSAISVPQQLALLEDRVLAFQPDVVIITLPAEGRDRLVKHLLSVADDGVSIPYPELTDILREAGVTEIEHQGVPIPFASLRRVTERLGIEARMPYQEAEARIRLAADEVMSWSIRQLAEVIRDHDAVPVLLALNTVGDSPSEPVPGIGMAEEAGFLILDLYDVYNGRDHSTLRVAPWDNHPNARAHRLIADRIYEELRQHVAAPASDSIRTEIARVGL